MESHWTISFNMFKSPRLGYASKDLAQMIIQHRDKQWWYKLNGAARHMIVRGALNSFSDIYVVTEYPKSGGTWLSQMISHLLEIPYTRNRLPLLKTQLLHGSYMTINKNIKTVVTWRDGRDTMVSYYYHLLFTKPGGSPAYAEALMKKLGITDPYDIEAKMPEFIEWAFTIGYPRFSWSDFANRWQDDENKIATSYEALSSDAASELMQIMAYFGRSDIDRGVIAKTVEKFSFQNQSNRKPGEEDVKSFIRKGIVGDWKNVFNREAREMFHHYGGKELIKLGYEKDDSWVSD